MKIFFVTIKYKDEGKELFHVHPNGFLSTSKQGAIVAAIFYFKLEFPWIFNFTVHKVESESLHERH